MNNCVFFLLILLVSSFVLIKIRVTCFKYGMDNKSKLSGFEVARKILDENNLDNMYIIEKKGRFANYYDFNHKVIKLATDVFHGETIMAIVLAAYQCSKAIMDKEKDKFYRFQAVFYPIICLFIYLSYLLFFIALLMNDGKMVMISISLFFFVLLFQLVTLPLEFKSKKQSLQFLKKYKLLDEREMEKGEVVLDVFVFYSVGLIVSLLFDFVISFFDSINNKKNR